MPSVFEPYLEQSRAQQWAIAQQPQQSTNAAPAVAEAPAPKSDFGSFLDEPTSVVPPQEHASYYTPIQQQWDSAFARQVRQRNFKNLADYEDFVKNLPGAIEEIKPHIQEVAKKWMPKHIASEYQEKTQSATTLTKYQTLSDIAKKLGEDWVVSNDSKGNPMLKHVKMNEKERQETAMKKAELDLKLKELMLKEKEMMFKDVDEAGNGEAGQGAAKSTAQAKPQNTQRDLEAIKWAYDPKNINTPQAETILRMHGLIQ